MQKPKSQALNPTNHTLPVKAACHHLSLSGWDRRLDHSQHTLPQSPAGPLGDGLRVMLPGRLGKLRPKVAKWLTRGSTERK